MLLLLFVVLMLLSEWMNEWINLMSEYKNGLVCEWVIGWVNDEFLINVYSFSVKYISNWNKYLLFIHSVFMNKQYLYTNITICQYFR